MKRVVASVLCAVMIATIALAAITPEQCAAASDDYKTGTIKLTGTRVNYVMWPGTGGRWPNTVVWADAYAALYTSWYLLRADVCLHALIGSWGWQRILEEDQRTMYARFGGSTSRQFRIEYPVRYVSDPLVVTKVCLEVFVSNCFGHFDVHSYVGSTRWEWTKIGRSQGRENYIWAGWLLGQALWLLGGSLGGLV